MREFTTPDSGAVLLDHGVADYLWNNARQRPYHAAIRRRENGSWVDVSFSQLTDEVTDTARGLLATGIRHGDRVALMSRTRWEWTVVDLALLAIGAVVVPVYETSSPDQVQWILSDSGARAVFVETAEHRATVESLRGELTGLEVVWTFDDGALKDLAAGGTDVSADDVAARRTAVTPDDLASIIYTSGTTGRPKGCELTHGNFVVEVSNAVHELRDMLNENSSNLLFLPIAHVFGRVIELGSIATGCTIGYSPDVKALLDDLASFRPTFLLAVPRVFEKVYNGAKQQAEADGHGKIFDRAAETAIAYSKAQDAGRIPLRVRAAHAVFARLVYSKILTALGGQAKAAVSGGAPLGARLGHFFRGIGLPVYEGYGLTETTAAVCVNSPGRMRVGTVGRPIPGISARIAEDGELLVKGGVVFRGYFQNTQATADALADGWFHTGDLGSIDEDGYVSIVGRKKEIIVTAGGKNVAPAVLEDRVASHWLVSQCLVVGDAQPFIGALVTIDPEAWPTWLSRHDRPADTTVAQALGDEALQADVQEAVDYANQAVSKAESIRRFTILPADWTQEAGQVTPSLKLKRNVVLQQNAAEIDALYSSNAATSR